MLFSRLALGALRLGRVAVPAPGPCVAAVLRHLPACTAVGTGVLPVLALEVEPSPKRARAALEPVTLPGDAGLRVSPLCLGTMSFVGALELFQSPEARTGGNAYQRGRGQGETLCFLCCLVFLFVFFLLLSVFFVSWT